MRPIRAILFDADGVVQHSNRKDVSVQLKRILGFIPADLDGLTREIFDVERSALAGRSDFAEVLVPVLEKWGASGVAGTLAAEWWCAIESDPSILALVARLRRQGIVCALASNQQRYRATYMEETLAYKSAFDHSFYSYQLGLVKPDIEYFKTIVAELALEPEEVLFIDDTERNVAAARRVGLQAAQFVHPRTQHAVARLSELLERFSIVVVEKDSLIPTVT